MTLKVESSQLLKGFIGTVVVYVLMNLTTPLLELLMASSLSVTWISFFIGLYTVSAGALAYVVMKTFGTLDKEMYDEVNKEKKKINQIASDNVISDNELTEKVEVLDEEYDKSGKILSEEELEKRIEEKKNPIVEDPKIEPPIESEVVAPIPETPRPTITPIDIPEPTESIDRKIEIEKELAELKAEGDATPPA